MNELSVLFVTLALCIKSAPGQSNDREFELKGKYCSNSSTCPTWFTCNQQSSNCQCGDGHRGVVACDDKMMVSAVLDCHCVTYEKETESTFTGKCFYNCENHHSKKKNDLVYYTLPKNPEMLSNISVCTYFNRRGILCGDCEEGHSPFVLSYNLSCVKCSDGHKNWWKFILAALVPLTFFYFFVILFQINVTSSRLHGVVWFSQALSTPVMVRLIMSGLSQGYPKILTGAKILMLFFSFWNLEIFRSIIPDICLNVSTLQALALEYIVALYPLLLMLITYLFIELYDRRFFCIVIVWKPFQILLTIFRRSWDIRTSVIDSFATFFLLSSIKVISVTTDLLVPTKIYKLGSNITAIGLYYSPTVTYFGRDHLPYAILAIVLFTLFVFLPTLIFFIYPFQLFQKCLSPFRFNWHFLHAFVDSFQGCYKDGTEPGTFDCRWFSAVFIFARLLTFLSYAMTLTMMYFIYGAIVLLTFLIATINIQPFKKVVVHYPSTDSIFLIISVLFHVTILGRSIASIHQDIYYIIMTLLLLVSAFVPIVYISFLIGLWFVSRRKWINTIINRISTKK